MAAAFIRQALIRSTEHQWSFLVSRAVWTSFNDRLDMQARLEVVHPSPGRPLAGLVSRKRLTEAERRARPDVVFTVFGPAYVRFQAPHVCGFANSWVTHPSRLAFDTLSLTEKAVNLARRWYKRLRLGRNDYYITETAVSQQGLARILGIPLERICVIPNNCSELFYTHGLELETEFPAGKQVINVLTLAGPYPHKNLLIIPEVARLLREMEAHREYRFHVTLPETGCQVRKFWEKASRLAVTDRIRNLGVLRPQECPRAYAGCDIFFLPTLLEVMSASYAEAMAMRRPIVTTDLDFARDTCGDAALYYPALSAREAGACLVRLANNPALRRALLDAGLRRLHTFPSPEEKYRRQMEWIVQAAGEKRGRQG